jgi:hypothetical protein
MACGIRRHTVSVSRHGVLLGPAANPDRCRPDLATSDKAAHAAVDEITSD